MIAATYGQLAEHEAAHEALRDLLVLKPDIVLIARDALARWYPPDLVEQLIDGLRKAGLDIAPAVVDASLAPDDMRMAAVNAAALAAAARHRTGRRRCIACAVRPHALNEENRLVFPGPALVRL